jgi:hypothetical protein
MTTEEKLQAITAEIRIIASYLVESNGNSIRYTNSFDDFNAAIDWLYEKTVGKK